MNVTIGPRRGSFLPVGETVSVEDRGAVAGTAPSCEGRFAPFPDLPEAPAAAVKVPEEDPDDTRMDVSGYHHNTAYDFLSLRPALYVSGKGQARFRGFRYRALP